MIKFVANNEDSDHADHDIILVSFKFICEMHARSHSDDVIYFDVCYLYRLRIGEYKDILCVIYTKAPAQAGKVDVIYHITSERTKKEQ